VKKIDKREIRWALQRMEKIIRTWDKLEYCDKVFLLSRWRSREGWTM
jgi:hypothetical protein